MVVNDCNRLHMVAIGSQWLTAVASGSQWQKNQPLPASKPFGILSLPMVQLAFNGWLVGCFGLNGPLRQYFSLYRAVSQREGERKEK